MISTLDGEICPFDKENEILVNKADQMNIRQIKDDDPKFQQCLYVYDVVYFNGQVLTDKPLVERIRILKKVIPNEIFGKIFIYLTVWF